MAIPPAQLARMRAEAAARFPDTAVVLTNTPSPNGRGGQADAWADGAHYPCRLTPGGGQGEKTQGAQPVSVQRFTLLLPHDAAVTPQQRVRIGESVYHVLDTDTGPEERITLTVTVERRQ